MRDRDTGRSRGFGFVTFGTEQEANAAIGGLNEQELDGRRIKVNLANSRGGGGGGGGGSFSCYAIFRFFRSLPSLQDTEEEEEEVCLPAMPIFYVLLLTAVTTGYGGGGGRGGGGYGGGSGYNQGGYSGRASCDSADFTHTLTVFFRGILERRRSIFVGIWWIQRRILKSALLSISCLWC